MRHSVVLACLVATCLAPVRIVAAEDKLRASEVAGQEYVGLWLKCLAEWEARTNLILLQVRKDQGTYQWGAEWGQPYSANGQGTIDSQRNLVLKGCSSYRGEIDKGCDPNNPPVFLTLPPSILINPAEATDEALLSGAWIRTSIPAWEGLEKRCACVARKTAPGCVDENSETGDVPEPVESIPLKR